MTCSLWDLFKKIRTSDKHCAFDAFLCRLILGVCARARERACFEPLAVVARLQCAL